MGKIDIEAKNYFSDYRRFSDVFNFWIYNGKSVIDPHSLNPLDTTQIAIAYGNDVKYPMQKFRDY